MARALFRWRHIHESVLFALKYMRPERRKPTYTQKAAEQRFYNFLWKMNEVWRWRKYYDDVVIVNTRLHLTATTQRRRRKRCCGCGKKEKVINNFLANCFVLQRATAPGEIILAEEFSLRDVYMLANRRDRIHEFLTKAKTLSQVSGREFFNYCNVHLLLIVWAAPLLSISLDPV